eukprot:COSAG01_NODE_2141_length_8319_cov_4.012406_8_plen_77_part_00
MAARYVLCLAASSPTARAAPRSSSSWLPLPTTAFCGTARIPLYWYSTLQGSVFLWYWYSTLQGSVDLRKVCFCRRS